MSTPTEQETSKSVLYDAFPRFQGSILSWTVRSENDDDTVYQVDLNALWDPIRREFNGQCSCPDFEMRRRKAFGEIGCVPKHTRCKHIEIALSQFTRSAVAAFAAQSREV